MIGGRLRRRHLLGLAAGALVLGLGRIAPAWGQPSAPAITVYKSPT